MPHLPIAGNLEALDSSHLVKIDRELGNLRGTVLRMGQLSERILANALDSVWNRDEAAARSIRQEDIEIDRMDVEIDQLVLRYLALQAPVARDLRQVIAAKTMASDLERVGDLARNIAKSSLRLCERPAIDIPPILRDLAAQTQSLLSDALRAYADIDAQRARRVLDEDDKIDQEEDRVILEAIRSLRQVPEHSEQEIDLIFIAKSLERVADHATNIAEDVILIAESLNLKHAGKLGA